MVVLVLGFKVLMNHIWFDEEDNLGSYVGSSDGIPQGKKLCFHFWKIS